MPLKILIVPDKFKGTLTAHAAAELIAKGWLESRPSDQIDLLPMSDGGDGFGDVLSRLLDVEVRQTRTIDAAHRPHAARWWWDAKLKTAIIESAQIIGLALLPSGRFHPYELDTFGLGAVLRDAAALGAEQCLVGIGGSATNDGGFGMARSLGFTFEDASCHSIEKWTELKSLARIIAPVDFLPIECTVAVDVQNPLLGPQGASRVYGPQKGLRPEDMPLAEACLERMASVAEKDLKISAAAEPGTGAAGGLGFGLRTFLGAKLQSGFDLFARHARLAERIQSADMVITGEGAIDRSTVMGKGVGEIARLCRHYEVPCIGLAGTLLEPHITCNDSETFTRVFGIAPQMTSSDDAKQNPFLWLPRLAAEAAKNV